MKNYTFKFLFFVLFMLASLYVKADNLPKNFDLNRDPYLFISAEDMTVHKLGDGKSSPKLDYTGYYKWNKINNVFAIANIDFTNSQISKIGVEFSYGNNPKAWIDFYVGDPDNGGIKIGSVELTKTATWTDFEMKESEIPSSPEFIGKKILYVKLGGDVCNLKSVFIQRASTIEERLNQIPRNAREEVQEVNLKNNYPEDHYIFPMLTEIEENLASGLALTDEYENKCRSEVAMALKDYKFHRCLPLDYNYTQTIQAKDFFGIFYTNGDLYFSGKDGCYEWAKGEDILRIGAINLNQLELISITISSACGNNPASCSMELYLDDPYKNENLLGTCDVKTTAGWQIYENLEVKLISGYENITGSHKLFLKYKTTSGHTNNINGIKINGKYKPLYNSDVVLTRDMDQNAIIDKINESLNINSIDISQINSELINENLFESLYNLCWINAGANSKNFKLSNPNCLILTSEENGNVVNTIYKNKKAAKIELTDNNPFTTPISFSASKIVYKRSFDDKKGYLNDLSTGWESIVLPFDVESIEAYAKDGTLCELLPMSVSDNGSMTENQRSFHLKSPSGNNLKDETSIKSNTPYLICVINNPENEDKYNITGEVSFIGSNVNILRTEFNASGKEFRSSDEVKYEMYYNFLPTMSSDDVYVINNTGSFFTQSKNIAINPFECYLKATKLKESAVHPESLPELFEKTPTNISEQNKDSKTDIKVYYKKSKLIIESNKCQIVYLSSIDGRLIKKIYLKEDDVVEIDIAKGAYLINGVKIIL